MNEKTQSVSERVAVVVDDKTKAVFDAIAERDAVLAMPESNNGAFWSSARNERDFLARLRGMLFDAVLERRPASVEVAVPPTAYAHFTGPQKLTIAVLRKTIREASLVCAALERMGHEAHPFGWSDPEKNASMKGLTFDLVDATGMDFASNPSLAELLWSAWSKRRITTFIAPAATPPHPTDPTPADRPLTPATAARLLHDDFALTLEEQTCILDALGCIDHQVNGRGHERAQRDSVETILAHIGELQHDAIRWQELQRAKAEPETSDPAVVLGAEGKAGSFVVEASPEEAEPQRQPGQSVKPWIVTRYAPNTIRIEHTAPFDSPIGAAVVCLSDHDAAHVARALRGEIDIERVIALVSPTRFGLRIERTYYDVQDAKALASRIEEALREPWGRDMADSHSPKPANPVKRDADLGDPVRITKFGQLWSLHVPSEADSYGVVVAREVGGDGVLRWKVCPIAEEADIASWCEGVERISTSEWLNLLGARAAQASKDPKPIQAGDTVRIKGSSHGDDRLFAVGRVENTGNGLEALLVWTDAHDGVGTKVVPVAALEVV